MFLGTLYTVIAIPLITIKPPKYDWRAIVSLNKINVDETFINWNSNTKLILNKLLTVFIKNKKNVKNLHIYSPKNENFFCVEPVTNTRDSYFFKKNNINYHGLKNLKPGKIFEAAVIFKIVV